MQRAEGDYQYCAKQTKHDTDGFCTADFDIVSERTDYHHPKRREAIEDTRKRRIDVCLRESEQKSGYSVAEKRNDCRVFPLRRVDSMSQTEEKW